MTYNAVVESNQGKSYRATVLGWPDCTVAGATREEALAQLREAVRRRLSEVEIVPLEIDLPENANPWVRFAGMFQDDPHFDEVVKEMEADRRELDEEEGLR
jgi:predicted RNase H-like HicB family nuclease